MGTEDLQMHLALKEHVLPAACPYRDKEMETDGEGEWRQVGWSWITLGCAQRRILEKKWILIQQLWPLIRIHL